MGAFSVPSALPDNLDFGLGSHIIPGTDPVCGARQEWGSVSKHSSTPWLSDHFRVGHVTQTCHTRVNLRTFRNSGTKMFSHTPLSTDEVIFVFGTAGRCLGIIRGVSLEKGKASERKKLGPCWQC